jgi:hypothetical protein
MGSGKSSKPVFLVEPLVMLGDLDKDIAGRIRFSRKGEKSGFLRDYSKMKIMDLSEVHAGGAGNAPILGQYLAKIILNKDTQRFSSPDWKMIHSYLIDSCGIKANQSRLYFSIFSAGGAGSGMASEFGLAQQHSYMNKTFDTKPMTSTTARAGIRSSSSRSSPAASACCRTFPITAAKCPRRCTSTPDDCCANTCRKNGISPTTSPMKTAAKPA